MTSSGNSSASADPKKTESEADQLVPKPLDNPDYILLKKILDDAGVYLMPGDRSLAPNDQFDADAPFKE